MPIYLIDKIKQKNGKDFKLMDAEDIETSDGKSLEEKFAEIGTVGKFQGNTVECKPSDVKTALEEGKTIFISHTDNTYGLMFFGNFSFSSMAMAVVASVALELNGTVMNACLMGDFATDSWSFEVQNLAKAEDIPKVTEEDNGKFLRVVGGKWAAASVSAAEEADF